MDQWVLGEVEEPRTTLADARSGADQAVADHGLPVVAARPGHAPAVRALLRCGLLMYGPPGCGKTYLARRWPASWGPASYGSTWRMWWTCGQLQPPQHP